MKRWRSLFLIFGITAMLLAPLAPSDNTAVVGAGAQGPPPTQHLAFGFPFVWQAQEPPDRPANWPPLWQGQTALPRQSVAGSTLDGSIVRDSVIEDLEPGFPVRAWHTVGSFYGGPSIHTLVGNINDDSTLEIVVTALASGPLYAWNSDGSPVPGWPVQGIGGAGYPAMGELSGAYPGLEVFSGYAGTSGKMAAYSGSGIFLPGWPRDAASDVGIPPALADIDDDGLDEIFIGEGDGRLHAYRADGTPLTGWPVSGAGGPMRTTPAIVDLDDDGNLEILTSSAGSVGAIYLFAYHRDGTPVAGFPVVFANGYGGIGPAVGDVDGDSGLEIVAVAKEPADPWRAYVAVLSANGAFERTIWVTHGNYAAPAPALADLDRDCVPEIVVQTQGGLEAWRGDGSIFPGWPVYWGGTWASDSAPVVGDVDGDTWPDIVVTTEFESSETGEVRVYDRHGNLLPEFPIELLLGSGAVPAVADMDLDGHNEVLVNSSHWPGYPGYVDKVWAYDLGGPPHGRIEWGQYCGGPRHQGYYPPGVVPVVSLDARNDGPTMLGHTTTLTATTREGCGVAYTWVLGDGALGSGDVLTHTYGALGTYTAVVTASNSGGLVTATTVVTIVEEPISGLQAASDSPTILGQATALTASVASGSQVIYTWDLGDGATRSGALIIHTYPAVGTYTAVVTASNSVSLLTATTLITVVDEPIAGLSTDSDSPTALGTPTTLSATVVAGGNVVYRWDLGDGALGSGAVLTHTYPAVGVYTAVVTASNFGSTSTTTATVLVQEAVGGLRAINNSPTPPGQPTSLAATIAAGTDVLYHWDLGDGITASWYLVSHVYPGLGTYTAVVTASNSVSLLTDTTVVVIADVPISGLAASNGGPTTLGNPTTLTATIATGSNVTYSWALGDGTTGAGATLAHTYPATGVYTAVVTASNSISLLRATTQVTVVKPAFRIYLPLVRRGH